MPDRPHPSETPAAPGPGPSDGWRSQAACIGKPPAWWFCDSPGSGRPYHRSPDFARAVVVCAGCPVREECRDSADHYEEYSLSSAAVHGVWAGEGPVERILRRREAGVTAVRRARTR